MPNFSNLGARSVAEFEARRRASAQAKAANMARQEQQKNERRKTKVEQTTALARRHERILHRINQAARQQIHAD